MLQKKLLWLFILLVVLPNFLFWLAAFVEGLNRDQAGALNYFPGGSILQFFIFIPPIGSVIMLIYSFIYKNIKAIILSSICLLLAAWEAYLVVVWAFSNFGF